MRTFLLATLLCVFDLAFGTNYPPAYYIPAGGQTINNLTYWQVASQNFYVSTTGSVNLGANTFTLTYASLPSANTSWNVIFDASNLTVTTATNVNLFGETPLSTYVGVTKFYINFNVVYVAGTPTKVVKYFASLDDLFTFSNRATFNNVVTFNDRADFNDTARFFTTTLLKPTSAILTGNSVVALDTTGKIGYGCTPWCVTGNSGLSNSNFLGNTDTVGLNFRVNNYPSGRVDYILQNTSLGYGAIRGNTTGTQNVSMGFSSMFANTTGGGNVGIGYAALTSNTTGSNNVAIGAQSGGFTTGASNSALGAASLQTTTTGTGNVGIGASAGATITTGSNNTTIGYTADVATASTTRAIALGYGAVASSNQLTIKGVRTISMPDATNSIRRVLMDTSGTGDFVPKVLTNYEATTFTPLTGDSITITTSQNDLNAAGTIAVLTVLLPASPYSGQILEFSTTQVVTSLLWSIRLSGGTTAGLPSTLAQYATAKIKWNSTLSRWLNY